jgi:multiple sugar transport system substrate-binding protein
MKLSRRSVMQGIGAAALASTARLHKGRTALAQAAQPVVYWGHNYPSRVRIVNDIMVPGFKKESGIEVVHNDFETNQLITKIVTGWAGGQGGPDLVSVGDYQLAEFIYRQLLAPVDPSAFGFDSQEELIDAYEPGVLKGFIFDGKLYGVPMEHGSISLFYRRDFFEEADLDPDRPPTTWEEVMDMGQKLTKRDANGKIVRAGWGWEARSLSSHFYYWGTLLPQKGVDFLNEDGTANGFSNDAGMAAFQYLYDTYHGEAISALGLAPTISPIDDFGTGLVAMINSGIWLPPAMERKYPSVSYADGVYGIARLPQFTDGTEATRLNPWVWAVSANSPVQKEAWQFVAYMTGSPENRAIWLEEAQYIQPWKGFEDIPAAKAIPYIDVFLADMKIGVPTPRTPRFNELASHVARAYEQIAANGQPPEQVVTRLANDIDYMLEF